MSGDYPERIWVGHVPDFDQGGAWSEKPFAGGEEYIRASKALGVWHERTAEDIAAGRVPLCPDGMQCDVIGAPHGYREQRDGVCMHDKDFWAFVTNYRFIERVPRSAK